MMKRIMKTRVAALAFAALPLTAAPALADEAPHRTQTAFSGAILSVGDASFYISVGNDRWRGRDGRYYNNDRYGQRPWEVRQMRRQAVRMCSAAIQREGYRAGFRDVDIDNDLRVNQIGPRGFRVLFDDVEFEGRRREFYRDVNCTVRQGSVVRITGLPERGRRGHGHHDDRWDSGRGDHHDRWDRGHNGYRSYSSTTTRTPVTRTVTTTRTVSSSDQGRGRTGPGGQRRYGKDGNLRGGRAGN